MSLAASGGHLVESLWLGCGSNGVKVCTVCPVAHEKDNELQTPLSNRDACPCLIPFIICLHIIKHKDENFQGCLKF